MYLFVYFKRKVSLYKNHQKVNGMNQDTCSKCGFVYTNEINKVQHNAFCVPRYTCAICPTKPTFGRLDNYNAHMKNKHTDKTELNICEICNKNYSSKGTLDRHIKDVHSSNKESCTLNNVYQCVKCSRTFSNSGELEKHINELHPPKPTVKRVCKPDNRTVSGYVENNALIKTVVVEGYEYYRCSICNNAHESESVLVKHYIEMHPEKKLPTCKTCDRLFSSELTLGVHVRHGCKQETTLLDEGFKCPICRSSFNRKDLLDRHVKTHVTDRPFKCSQCDYSCKRNDNLTDHVKRKHSTEEKKFVCDKCGFAFMFEFELNRHIVSCKQIGKNYTCPHCPMTFTRNDGLTLHIRLKHTGGALIICPNDGCGETFYNEFNLRRHLKYVCGKNTKANGKVYETAVNDALIAAGIIFQREYKIDFSCLESDTTKAVVDFFLMINGCAVFLEVDEQQHSESKYNLSCELARMAKMVEVAKLNGIDKVRFIRFNPNTFSVDEYDSSTNSINKEEVVLTLNMKIKKLIEVLKNPDLDFFVNEKPLSLQYMFYDTNKEGYPSITDDASYTPLFKECCLKTIV